MLDTVTANYFSPVEVGLGRTAQECMGLGPFFHRDFQTIDRTCPSFALTLDTKNIRGVSLSYFANLHKI
jgi:hypothetical protein